MTIYDFFDQFILDFFNSFVYPFMDKLLREKFLIKIS